MINPIDLVKQGVSFYIDPGSITMIIQVAIVSAIAGIFTLKVFWNRIRAFLVKLFKRSDD